MFLSPYHVNNGSTSDRIEQWGRFITYKGVFPTSKSHHYFVYLGMDQIQDLVGPKGWQFVVSMIERASSSVGVTASILGTIALLVGALGAFNE